MSLPSRSVSVLEYPFAGFTFRAPNAPQYSGSWQMQMNVPADFGGRSALERWQFAIANEFNSCGLDTNFPCENTSLDLAVTGPGCSIVRGYRLIGIFPSEIGEIAYDQTATDRVNFSTTFTYQRWEPLNINDTVFDLNTSSQIDSIYEGFESKIAQGVGSACLNKTSIPRV